MLLLLALACAPDDPSTKDSPAGSADSSDDSAAGPSDTAPVDTLSDVRVSVHPVIGSLLVVSWTQTAAADTWVEYALDGEATQVTPTKTREAGAQEQIVAGVPYDTDVQVRVVTAEGGTDPVVGHTDPLPETVPAPVLESALESAWAPEDRWLLIGLSSGGEGWEADSFWKLILDRQGRVVWAHETPNNRRTFYMQPSHEGTELVWDECSFWTEFDEGEASVVHRMTLDGTEEPTIPVPGLHHAFLDLGGGAVLWGGVDDGREVLRQHDADGTVRELWDCSAYWDAHDASAPCDGNALYWDEAADTILYSSDSGNSVAEVDHGTGSVLRTFGSLDDSYTFAEGTRAFVKQHSPTFTADGTLLLSSWTNDSDHQILAREYSIDADAQSLTEILTCGIGTGTTGEYAGEAHRLENGDTLLNYGEGGEIREFDPDCAEVWHLSWPYANLLGRAVFVEDLYAFLPA